MVEIELAVVGETHALDASIFLFGEKLPWYEVGVMIHRGHDDEIAGLDVAASPGLRHQVDRLSRIPNEDDLARRGGIDEVGHHMPGRLILRLGTLGEVVDPTVKIAFRL